MEPTPFEGECSFRVGIKLLGDGIPSHIDFLDEPSFEDITGNCRREEEDEEDDRHISKDLHFRNEEGYPKAD